MHQALLGRNSIILQLQNLGPGDLLMRDQAEEEAQGTVQDLDRPPEYLSPQDPPLLGRRFQLQMSPGPPYQVRKPCSLSYIGILLSSLRAVSQSLRLMTHLDVMDQEMPLEHRPCQGLPRVRDRHQDHLAVLVDPKMWL